MSGLPTVRELMDIEFVKLKPDMSVAQAITMLLDNKITGATVVNDSNQVVGLLSEKDCLNVLLHGAYEQMPTGQVSEYMSTDVETIPPDTDIFKLAELFLKTHYRRYPVVEYGVLVGQITRRDLLRAIHKYSA